MIKAWLTFIHERFPLLVYGNLSLGFTLSTAWLSHHEQILPTGLVATIGILLFFFTLRIMDEYKDYQKDLIAHPERPLPRGLISPQQAKRAIHLLMAAMLVFAALMHFFYGFFACAFYLVTGGYLYLMFKEFFIGKTLSNHPLLYAFSHQIILFPLIFFSFSLFGPLTEQSAEKWLYAAMVFFAFFTYEICRKLDPKAPLILGTYWRVSGKLRTCLCLVFLTMAATMSAMTLSQSLSLMPVNLSILVALAVFLMRPQFHKWVEITASLSLFLHIWSVGFWRLIA